MESENLSLITQSLFFKEGEISFGNISNIKELDSQFEIELAIPGKEKDDFEIS